MAVGVALAAPVVLLVTLELGLRVAGYGSDLRLFVPYGPPESGYMVPNPRLGARYFPGAERPPRPATDVFRARKPDRSLRLFVQGASSAAGFPFGYGGAFSRMLEQRLARTYPDREVEVVNTSLAGTSSYTLLDVADEIAAREPDAVLIYAGHNEYYGAFGVASSAFGGRAPRAVRLYLSLARLRTVQLAASIRASVGGHVDSDTPARTLMEELAGNQSIAFGGEEYRAGIRQLRENLRRILEVYRRADVPVYLATIASNVRDLPPFEGAPEVAADSAALFEGLESAAEALVAGDSVLALTRLRELGRDLPTAAAPRFAVARLMDRSARFDSARTRYREARDRDRLPFRAPGAVNRVIREEAARAGAAVVDARGRLEAASPHGLLGATLMLEHVHPNVEGQFLIADAFYERIVADRLIPDPAAYVPVGRARPDVPVTAVDSLIGAFYIQRLTAGFPFHPRGVRRVAAVDTLSPRNTAEAIALDLFHGRISWIEAQQRLRDHLVATDSLRAAIHVDRVLAQEFPFAPPPLLHAAVAARLLGDLEETARFATAARERGAGAPALILLGGVAASRGDSLEARRCFREAARLDPGNRRVVMARRALDALPELQDEASRNDDLSMRCDLAAVYYLTGQYDRARDVADAVLSVAPGQPAAARVQEQLRSLLAPGSDRNPVRRSAPRAGPADRQQPDR